jgi:multidrug efflux pump subunit AcrA (membrane-fusion protein)
MMAKRHAALGVLLICLSGTLAWAADGPVQLTPQAIAAGGIELAPIAAARHVDTLPAFGEVLDPSLLAALAAQLAEAKAASGAAEAKLSLARANADRATRLFHAEHNVSTADFQSAEATAHVAAAELETVKAKLLSLEASIRASWGSILGTAIQTGGEPLPALRTGNACLIQAVLPFGQALRSPPQTASAVGTDGGTLALKLIGPSPRLPSGVSGPAFFYLASGTHCPAIGMPLQVGLPNGTEHEGVFVPASAVVWQGAQPIVWQEMGKDSFAAHPIDTGYPQNGGYFVPTGPEAALRPGTSIVVHGAALLLSESQAPAEKASAAGDNDED